MILAESYLAEEPDQGVRVSATDKDVALDLIFSEIWTRIPEAGCKVQEASKVVEGMTDLKVTQVNIHVQGVTFQDQIRHDTDTNNPAGWF